jgi:acetyltransferase-like isoleucine patch superfamily enzyme
MNKIKMNNKIATTSIIYPNVQLGKNVVIEDFCLIGIPVSSPSDEITIIKDNAHIRAGTYIYAGNKIGKNFQTGNKVNIRELNTIGDDVSIGTLSDIEHHALIGNGVRIHSQAFIPEYTILDDHCWIGPNVVITNAKYPLSQNAKDDLKAVHVFNAAKIGANSTLLPGVKVGINSLIGAGSVVTNDIEDNVIAFGNPAIVFRQSDY